MNCPHCQHELTPSEIAALLASLRKTRGGRTRSAQRCPCGMMTVDRALKRGHKCDLPVPEVRDSDYPRMTIALGPGF